MPDSHAACIALESDSAEQAIKDNDLIIYTYATPFFNVPIFVRDYIKSKRGL
ncbi:MAG: hypothetical protein PHG02_05925 [Oscillospiraceae bacterium]|nr:hypothetical protein [Oscillospiraceae bacterium]